MVRLVNIITLRHALILLACIASSGSVQGSVISCSSTAGKILDSILHFCDSELDFDSDSDQQTQAIKLIVAGPGRTGTSSINEALSTLGYHGLHGSDLFNDPELATLYANENWDEFYENVAAKGYNATLDTFTAGLAHVKEQLSRYPDAKVIIAKRDSLEVWYKSWATLLSYLAPAHQFPLRYLSPAYAARLAEISAKELFPGAENPVLCCGLDTSEDASSDPVGSAVSLLLNDKATKDMCMAAIERYYEEIEQMLIPENKLVFNVKDGYEPLCRFLGIVECPNDDFPWANDKAEMQTLYLTLNVMKAVILLTPVLLVWLIARKCRFKSTKSKFD